MNTNDKAQKHKQTHSFYFAPHYFYFFGSYFFSLRHHHCMWLLLQRVCFVFLASGKGKSIYLVYNHFFCFYFSSSTFQKHMHAPSLTDFIIFRCPKSAIHSPASQFLGFAQDAKGANSVGACLCFAVHPQFVIHSLNVSLAMMYVLYL